VRADRSTSASDPDGAGEIKFTADAAGFHAVNPAAAVYWNPANIASGNYTAKATFTLVKPSGHTNYYGLVIGGSNLDNDQQTYLYFLVGQNGTWMISRRAGSARPTAVAPKTANAAVTQPGADGTSVNALEVRVNGDTVNFVVNGTVVHTAAKADLGTTTDGIVGLRVNHQLEVKISGFAVTK
jgi:plastocyanin